MSEHVVYPINIDSSGVDMETVRREVAGHANNMSGA